MESPYYLRVGRRIILSQRRNKNASSNISIYVFCILRNLGATPYGEKPSIYLDPCRGIFEGAMHRSRGISRGARKLAGHQSYKRRRRMILNGWMNVSHGTNNMSNE
jgi:hypothetical protein